MTAPDDAAPHDETCARCDRRICVCGCQCATCVPVGGSQLPTGRRRTGLWNAPAARPAHADAVMADLGAAITEGVTEVKLREAVADELGRHQGLRGPMVDERPDVWQNRCVCGWDDGDERPGWRERYRLHVADAVLRAALGGQGE